MPADIQSDELRQWVDEHFFEPGFEVDAVLPNDWTPSPTILSTLQDHRVKELVTGIHHRWRELVRFYNASKLNADSVSSHLPLPRPFVVPGGRFNEFYYWDSYWILQGLLISEMTTTGRDLISNLLDAVRIYGFVPNGSRRYYDNRSQPPLLAAMMRLYEQRTGDIKFVRQNLHLLEQEYEFWMRERSVKFRNSKQKNASNHVLNLYHAHTTSPRPESFYEDVEQGLNMTKAAKIEFFSNVASVAESGWDFSSRWMNFTALTEKLHDPLFVQLDRESQQNQLLQLLIITDLVPFDLNGILYQYERTLQMYFCRWRYEQINYDTRCQWYGEQARRRFWSMRSVMYNEQTKLWSDYNLKEQQMQSEHQLPARECVDLNEPTIRLVNEDAAQRRQSCSQKPQTTNHPIYVTDIGSLWYFDKDWQTEDVVETMTPTKSHQENVIEREIQRINRNILNQLLQNFTEQSTAADVGLTPLLRMLLGEGGIASSNVLSGQQWDYPNAWAPYEQYVVTGLLDTLDRIAKMSSQNDTGDDDDDVGSSISSTEADQVRRLARKLSRNWLQSTYCSWHEKKSLYEKYDVRSAGRAGAGGEYIVQEGFGWTNGVTMRLAEMYAKDQMVMGDCSEM